MDFNYSNNHVIKVVINFFYGTYKDHSNFILIIQNVYSYIENYAIKYRFL